MKRVPTIAVSGGFDPIHKGHVQMIREAAEYGRVIVFLNSDAWLIRKKGYKFMPFEERAYIAGSIKGVSIITNVDDSDGTVCKALERFKPDYFANGGDRYETNTPEMKVCKDLGIQMLWNIGGGKIQSSSELVTKAQYGRRIINGQEL
tara:strand:+ start:965 stop:1408 length:444 start_codon:yes stop_codon:yes gene_type:complete